MSNGITSLFSDYVRSNGKTSAQPSCWSDVRGTLKMGGRVSLQEFRSMTLSDWTVSGTQTDVAADDYQVMLNFYRNDTGASGRPFGRIHFFGGIQLRHSRLRLVDAVSWQHQHETPVFGWQFVRSEVNKPHSMRRLASISSGAVTVSACAMYFTVDLFGKHHFVRKPCAIFKASTETVTKCCLCDVMRVVWMQVGLFVVDWMTCRWLPYTVRDIIRMCRFIGQITRHFFEALLPDFVREKFSQRVFVNAW